MNDKSIDLSKWRMVNRHDGTKYIWKPEYNPYGCPPFVTQDFKFLTYVAKGEKSKIIYYGIYLDYPHEIIDEYYYAYDSEQETNDHDFIVKYLQEYSLWHEESATKDDLTTIHLKIYTRNAKDDGKNYIKRKIKNWKCYIEEFTKYNL